MKIRDVVRETGVSRTTVNNYVVHKIIHVEKRDISTGERVFAADSTDRVNLTRRLTSMGFRLGEISAVLSRRSVKDVEIRLSNMGIEEFGRRFDRQ